MKRDGSERNVSTKGKISTHWFDGLEDCIEIGKITGLEFGIKRLPINDDLKCATA
ncbi:MAG TPA: hypothetical protein VNE63_18185 [Candidatus Acidoferrales bacterium]|nr:hypothetical protein [Candidatus Acidoferrales bacterium]